MAEFNSAQLRRLDLSLLLVFDAIYETGKFTGAAKRLGLTQSAISHAVARLRDIFGDELFLRLPHGVAPTHRAREIRGPVVEALRLVSGTLGPARFDPASDDRIFRIGSTDHLTALFAGRLAQEVTLRPRYEFTPIIRAEALEALHAGDLDLALGFIPQHDGRFDHLDLYEERYSVVGRADHPAFAAPLTIETYTTHGHVLTSPGGGLRGVVDTTLARLGAERRVVVAVPNVFPALAALAGSDLLLTAPRRLAEAYAAPFGLRCVAPPMPIRSFTIRMIWSRRHGADPGLLWLKERIATIAASFASPEK